MSLKRAPVVIEISDKDILKMDLMKELRVDKHNLGHELLSQPARYAFWGTLYAAVESKTEVLEGRLEELFGELARHYTKHTKKPIKATELKYLIVGNHEYQKLRRRLWRWRQSERFLKQAVRSFDQRINALQSYAADQRKERDSEPRVKSRHRED